MAIILSRARGRLVATMLVALRTVRASSAGDAGRAAPVRAVLFDFDGSLVQSEEAHRLSFSAVLGRDLDRATWYSKCVGRGPTTILREFRAPDSPSVEELAALLKADAIGRYEQVGPTDGHSQLLDDLDRADICMAIVSSGSRAYIERVLERLGLAHRFKLLIAGDDPEVQGHHKVSERAAPWRGRGGELRCSSAQLLAKRLPLPLPYTSAAQPDPLPYLLAAERLGFAPAECVAIEDSPAGIQSALSAGMRVVALNNPANRAHSVLLHQAVVAKVDDFHGLPRTVLGCVVGSEPPVPAAVDTGEQP